MERTDTERNGAVLDSKTTGAVIKKNNYMNYFEIAEEKLKEIRGKLKIDVSQNRTTEQSKADMLKALKEQMGIVTPALAIADVGRTTFYAWIQPNSDRYDGDFKKHVENFREEHIDFAESKLIKAIQEDKESSIHYLLSTQGKKRGYIKTDEFRLGNIDGEKFEIASPLVDKVLAEEYGNADNANGDGGSQA